jgi:hypothetical protein
MYVHLYVYVYILVYVYVYCISKKCIDTLILPHICPALVCPGHGLLCHAPGQVRPTPILVWPASDLACSAPFA